MEQWQDKIIPKYFLSLLIKIKTKWHNGNFNEKFGKNTIDKIMLENRKYWSVCFIIIL